MQLIGVFVGPRKIESEAMSEMLNLEQFLPYRLNVLAELVSQSLARIYSRQYGIGIPEWRVLATLGQFETMTAKQIGNHSRMHKTKVSRAVSALTERGLVSRTSNAQDLREVFLSLTDDGRAIYEEVLPAAKAFSDRLIGTLNDDERRNLDAILTKLSDRSIALADEIAREYGE